MPRGGVRCLKTFKKALPRIKLISSRCGIDVGEDREISPADFLGKEIDVEIKIRRRIFNGETRYENFVPFAGYQKRGESVPEGDVPF